MTLTLKHRMRVSYRGGRPVVIKGPVTGIDYRFSGIEQTQLVDPRDGVVLVRNQLFRIEGIVETSTAEVVSSSNGTGDHA
jgi:hypothetical protein